ncbi:SRPBCC family protein [bacterium]|nr:SRPBCC family protein [bacterium]
MPGFAFTQLVNAPIPTVFAAFSDFEHAADRVTDIVRTEMLTPGPVGVGTKFKETRKVFGKESTETMEVTAFEPNQLIELTANSCGAEFKSRFTFAPDGPATRVGVDVRTRALSVFAKLFTPMAYLMMGTIKACVRRDIEQIKAGVEGVPTPA